MFWKNWPYWLRGGVITLVVCLIAVIYQQFGPGDSEGRGFLLMPLYSLLVPIWFLIEPIKTIPGAVIIFSMVYYFVIGSIIGAIIGAVKKKKSPLA